MRRLALVLIFVIAALHLYIAWFEMFAWVTRGPRVLRSFPAALFGPPTLYGTDSIITQMFLRFCFNRFYSVRLSTFSIMHACRWLYLFSDVEVLLF